MVPGEKNPFSRDGASETGDASRTMRPPACRVRGVGTCNATLLHHLKFVTLMSSFEIIRENWLILNSFNEFANES